MRTFRRHWPEYAIEGALLGLFMVSACGFAALLEHPASVVRAVLPEAWVRRLLMGCAMGLTAIAIIYSPWGQRSGAHINPATTLAFLRLGRVPRHDALFYAVFQFTGAALGVLVVSAAIGAQLADPSVRWAVTAPGHSGAWAAFAAEVGMTFALFSAVLHLAASRHARFTGLCVGLFLVAYITVFAPISGMSLNPARTFGSSVVAGVWSAGWVYFTAPPLGMLLAAEVFTRGRRRGGCAKLHHTSRIPCIFCGAGGGR